MGLFTQLHLDSIVDGSHKDFRCLDSFCFLHLIFYHKEYVIRRISKIQKML